MVPIAIGIRFIAMPVFHKARATLLKKYGYIRFMKFLRVHLLFLFKKIIYFFEKKSYSHPLRMNQVYDPSGEGVRCIFVNMI